VMKTFWDNGPLAARDVYAKLPENHGWAVKTVKTMLTRLAAKKYIKETKKGNVGLYKPLLSRPDAQRNALKSLVNQAFDGAFGPLMHFLLEDEKLSKTQKEELTDILEQKQQDEQKGAEND
jgi:BlaI family penicillinase repressor